MSLSLTLYLVDLERARGAIGSGDDKLLRQIGGRFKADLARADEWFSSEIERGAPTRHDALRAVIEGGPFDARYGFQYGYAYEMICRHFGRYLNNNAFSPFRGDWLEEVDRGLGTLGIDALRVTTFMYGGPPAPLPRPSDFPGYGEWSAERCAEGLAQWQATTPEARAAVEPMVLDAIAACVEWTREAQAKPGSGVAGFGY
ncbi:MAG: hypothetical protein H6710_00360 [Myxococcales bacterium]|nr:hypothetical protein [Myxococcales bacterium]